MYVNYQSIKSEQLTKEFYRIRMWSKNGALDFQYLIKRTNFKSSISATKDIFFSAPEENCSCSCSYS